MSQSKIGKFVVACVITLTFGVVAWRAVNRSPAPPRVADTPAPSADAGDAEAADIEARIVAVPVAEFNFETIPTPENLSDIESRAATRITEAGRDAFAGSALTVAQQERFAEIVARHLRVLLAGDYEEWLAFASEFGPPPDLARWSDGLPAEEFFANHSSRFSFAPISLDDLTVRPLRIRGAEIEYPPVRLWFRATVRGTYPKYDEERLASMDIYEVLFPAHYKTARSDVPNVRLLAGIAYAWDTELQRWTPFDFKCYTNGVGSIPMRSPVF